MALSSSHCDPTEDHRHYKRQWDLDKITHKTNNMIDTQRSQETAIDRLNATDIIPIKNIERIFAAPINHTTQLALNPKKFDNQCQFLSSIYQLLRLMETGRITMQRAAQCMSDLRRAGYSGVQKAYAGVGLEVPVYSQITFTGFHNSEEVYNLHLAHFSEDELHFGDITLQNVRRNLPPQIADFFKMRHPGIGNGVFDTIMQNLSHFAKEAGYKRISLSAIDMLRVETFAKRGFALRPGQLLDASLPQGMSIPMVKEL